MTAEDPRPQTYALLSRRCCGWYQPGVDVPSRIPWLSTYLGHREPRYTYHYLSAAPELLAHAARLLDDAQAVRP